MQFFALTLGAIATLAIPQASAALLKRDTPSTIADIISPVVKANYPDAYNAFLSSPISVVHLNQEQSLEGEPNPNRTEIIPDYIYVLQCHDAAFKGDCLVFAAPPGMCANYFDFNNSEAFVDEYNNQTSSLSTDTNGLCQFYRYIDCDNKGDDAGVSLSYVYDLGISANGYSGDYDKQISSCRCYPQVTHHDAYFWNREMLKYPKCDPTTRPTIDITLHTGIRYE